jgi:DNA invertase Pin-like site-specific DNA recombinase
MNRKIKKLEPKIHKLPAKKRVAAYARVSSGKDAMFHSLSAQISYYSELIQKNPSWLYIGVYADNAMTGTKDERPEFQRLIEDCKSGKIDMVIVKSISRFARNTVTLLKTVRELKSKNIDVFFENENIHSMSGDGELMLSILASFAQEESRSVSENCKWRIRKQFEKGELANLRFLYGYNIKKGEITVNDEQAWVVKHIFNNYVSGENCAEIARDLNESHAETLKKHEWTSDDVRRVLKNEKYAGNAMLQKSFVSSHLTKKQQKNKGELPMFWALNTHTPIIDKYTFDLAQEKLKQNFKKCNIQAERNLKYPFTGKIKCGICGKNFR